MTTTRSTALALLERLGLGTAFDDRGDLVCSSPIDGSEIGRLRSTTPEEVHTAVAHAHSAFGT